MGSSLRTTGRRCFSLLVGGLIAAHTAIAVANHADWKSFESKPDSWYASPDGLQVAANILSWQSLYGSWPKNLDTTAAPADKPRSSIDGTWDNSATVGEMRFLARAYNITGNTQYKNAVLLALDDILGAQYPTGGWPQYNPPGSGYHRYITFNDDAMVHIMYLLKDVVDTDRFAFVGAARQAAASSAFDRGIECILNCQIMVGGKLTAWCAQHDEVTLEPRPARTYEHESISGSESVGIVLLLMKYGDTSDPRIVKSINSACEWFDDVKLLGIRQVVIDGDKKIIDDPTAPPLWARFYEIGTNRPIFSGRDGIIKYDISEIEYERRNGYSWYVDRPEDALAAWPAWLDRVDTEPVGTPAAGRTGLGICIAVCLLGAISAVRRIHSI